MDTVLTRDPAEAAWFISHGGIVAFPTETVYGLGANVFDTNAIKRVFEAKERPSDNPLIAHVSALSQITELAAGITEDAGKFIDAFFPGPLTLVVRKRSAVPPIATAGLDTIGVRMPANDLAYGFISSCGVPLVAPSANLSGRPSPTTWRAVFEDLDGRIDCILQGRPTKIGLESTVVDCSCDTPVLLRPGAISLEELRNVVPATRIGNDQDGTPAKSPGLRYRHYSPRGAVILVDINTDFSKVANAAFIGLHRPTGSLDLERVCPTMEAYAHAIFEFFRECDRHGVATIYCEQVEEDGIGRALMDRLRRAAAK